MYDALDVEKHFTDVPLALPDAKKAVPWIRVFGVPHPIVQKPVRSHHTKNTIEEPIVRSL